MITLHAFANMFPGGTGETKDMWVQWALEEMALPYTVRAWDYLGGETQSPAFTGMSPFNQLPVLEHDGLILAESAAILVHLAQSSGRLIPADAPGRARVIQWCVAAQATVAYPLFSLSMIGAGMFGEAPQARTFMLDLAARWLTGLEHQLDGRDWIAADDFTIADILLAGVLREVRHTDLLDSYPAVKAFHARALSRPAWPRTLALYAERLGIDVADLD